MKSPQINVAPKVMTLEQAVEWRKELQKQGKKLAVTNGCFDILHRGHAEYLQSARNTADALLVLVNADASIRQLKGPTRPICKELDRAFLLACLEFIDAVVIFDSQRCNKELAALAPDVYVKGGDYTVEKLDPSERGVLMDCGAEFQFIPFVPGYSTTAVIKLCEGSK